MIYQLFGRGRVEPVDLPELPPPAQVAIHDPELDVRRKYTLTTVRRAGQERLFYLPQDPAWGPDMQARVMDWWLPDSPQPRVPISSWKQEE